MPFGINRGVRSVQLSAWLALACSVQLLVPTWAASLTQVTSVTGDPEAEQVILNLSGANQASLLAPLERKQRLLVLDIKNATLENLPDKAVFLEKIRSQLSADIAEVSLDEFRGTEPRVRMVIKTKNPEITGALIQGEGQRIVLQLIKTGSLLTQKDASPDKVASPETPIVVKEAPVASSSDNEPAAVMLDKESAEKVPTLEPMLKAQTSKVNLEKALDRKSNEAEHLKYQRNELDGQVQNLQKTLDSQRQMMVNLKDQQEHLLTQYDNRPERRRIVALQEELASLQDSYDVLRQTLMDYQAKVDSLRAELKAREQSQAALEAQWKDSGKVLLPEDATTRAGLINTLDTLTKPEVNAMLDAEKGYREAQKAIRLKEWTRAEMLLKQSVQASPQVPLYSIALAECYTQQKRLDKAQSVLQDALKRHPEDMGLLNELGKLSLAQNDAQGALNYFQKAFPSGLLSNYASTLRRLNRLKDAEALMALAVDTHPADSDLQFNLGSFYLTQKRYTDAKSRFMEAVKLKPGFAEAYYNLGVTYGQLGQYDLAKGALETYLKLAPQAANKTTVESYLKDLGAMQPATN